MLDFAKLSAELAAERALPAEVRAERRAIADASRVERIIAADENQRSLEVKTAVTGKLVYEPEMRSLPNGDDVVVFKAIKEGQATPMNIAYVTSERERLDPEARAALDFKLRSIGGGDEVSFAGQWQKRGWNKPDGERVQTWEFAAKGFEKGPASMEQIMERGQSVVVADGPMADRMSGIAVAHRARQQGVGVGV